MITKPPAQIQTEHLEFWNAIGAIFLSLMWMVINWGGDGLFAAMAVASSLCYFYAYGIPLSLSRLFEFVVIHLFAFMVIAKLDYPHLAAAFLYLTLPMNRFLYYPEYRGYTRRQEWMTNTWIGGMMLTVMLNLIGESWMKGIPFVEFMSDGRLSFILAVAILPWLLADRYGCNYYQKKTTMAWIFGLFLLVLYDDIIM